MRVLIAAMLLALSAGAAQAQSVAELGNALRGGGYVLLIRHASSPQTPPAPAEAEAENFANERQLDAAGKLTSKSMGEAVRALPLQVGQVWSSPAYRALQTVRFAQLPAPDIAQELGDGGHSMRAVGTDQGAWLRALVAKPPKAGTVNLIITHLPNISAAFGARAAGITDGEALVFRSGETSPSARIKPEDWSSLAAAGER